MLVRQAFRYELAPTAAQRAVLANHAGAARWAWNWGLSVRRKAYDRRRQTLTAIDLHRLLVRLKRTPRYGWLYEVSKCAPQEAWQGGQPQAAGVAQPCQGRAGVGAGASAGPQSAAGRVAQGDHGAGESQVGDRGGGSERGRDGPEPSSGQGNQRSGLGAVPPSVALQDDLVRIPSAGRTTVLPVVKDLFWMWAGEGGPTTQRADVLLPCMRAGAGPRPERREESCSVCGDRGWACRREFPGDAKRLWRGERWPGRRRLGGTTLGEAGTGRISTLTDM